MLQMRRKEQQDEYVQKQVDDGKGGYQMEYVYNGSFYTWDEPVSKLKLARRSILLLALCSLFLFLKAAFTIVPQNLNALVSAVGMISFIPWYFELRNEGRFCLTRRAFKEKEMNYLKAGIYLGGMIRAAMVICIVVVGITICVNTGQITQNVMLVMVEYVLSAICSVVSAWIFSRQKTMQVPNLDGEAQEITT
jgi:hypothetical protein